MNAEFLAGGIFRNYAQVALQVAYLARKKQAEVKKE